MNVKNLTYNKVGTIDLEIEHKELGWMPFTASPTDNEDHGREIYAAAIAGELGEIAPYIEPVKTAAEKAADERAKRDALLVELDDVVKNPLRWESFSAETKNALSDYRQALLDVPQQSGFPETINWPVMPVI